MTIVTDAVRAVLVPFLVVTGTVLLALVGHVVLLHGLRELAFRRGQRLVTMYRPLITAALQGSDGGDSLERLKQTPRRHRRMLADLLLEPLKVAEGSLTERARAVADALELTAEWHVRLADRRWWIRAQAAHALGLLKCRPAVSHLVRALDDPVDDVRAAAVEALGLIAEPAAIPELIARLREQPRYHRVRVVQALRQFGAAAVPLLLQHAAEHSDHLASIADLLGSIEAASALPELIAWSTDDRPEVRTAAVRAIGAIGVDDRAYYHVLRALNDSSVEVRAAAAWTLGRSRRHDAASYLAPHLRDEWIVAAQSARALGQLGAAGRVLLESAAADEGGELARQMLWESGAASRV